MPFTLSKLLLSFTFLINLDYSFSLMPIEVRKLSVTAEDLLQHNLFFPLSKTSPIYNALIASTVHDLVSLTKSSIFLTS